MINLLLLWCSLLGCGGLLGRLLCCGLLGHLLCCRLLHRRRLLGGGRLLGSGLSGLRGALLGSDLLGRFLCSSWLLGYLLCRLLSLLGGGLFGLGFLLLLGQLVRGFDLHKLLVNHALLQSLADERSQFDDVALVVGSDVLLDGWDGRPVPLLERLDGFSDHGACWGMGRCCFGLLGHCFLGRVNHGGVCQSVGWQLIEIPH